MKSPIPIEVRELHEVELETAARVYAQGLLMEVPPGSKEPLESLTKRMRQHLQQYLQQKDTRQIWVATAEGQPCGILDFYHKKNELRIRFLCAIPPRRGIGTQLITHLAQFALAHNATVIHTTVSSLDQRAMNFYFQHLGFQQTGQRREDTGFKLYLAKVKPQILLQRVATQSGTTTHP